MMKILFSVLVPLYNTPEEFLQDMIESVRKQTYKNWELCLADASDEKHSNVGAIVETYVKKDKRIKYTKLKENKGISINTNECIKMATGNYFALLDHDDILHGKALEEVARVIEKQHADFVYTDEAKFTTSIQEWFAPNYKPDFSKYELTAHNYICHLTVYSRHLLKQVGPYRKACDGSQDHDMVLRLTEKANCIVHIPKVLYYWRVHKNSVSSGVENKSYAIDAAKKAVMDHVERCGGSGRVITHEPFPSIYHVQYDIKEKPKISVVLYGEKDINELKRCVESIENNAGYENYEYLIFTDSKYSESFEDELNEIEDIHKFYIFHNMPFNQTDLINKILEEKGQDYILFMNFDSEVDSADFLLELLMLAQQEDVGFVGPKILDMGDNIRNAGVALTKETSSGIVKRFWGEPAGSYGYEAGLCHIRSTTALFEDCMMIRSDKFKKIKGFSSKWRWYKGIDACLRVNGANYVNVWTPYAVLIEYAEEVEPKVQEVNEFKNAWKYLYTREDPFYNKFIRYDIDHIHDKNTPKTLCKKSLNYLRDEGIIGLMDRINVYHGKSGKHSSLHVSYIPQSGGEKSHTYKDVLFINGCAPSVPHPPRYRVTHQREQLEACNITTGEVYYEELNPDIVNDYRSFIFFRCPYTDNVGELIKRAKAFGRLVLFDIDDLVVDTKYTDTIPYVMTLKGEAKKVYDDGVIRMGKTLKLCDGAITTTERLAEELSHYVPEVFINRNVASERMYELSERAVYERDVLPFLKEDELPSNISKSLYRKAKDKQLKRKQSGVRIGYFSGSITHNADFDMIRPALIRILKKYPAVTLHLVGELELPEEMKPFRNQIVTEPFTDWERLPALIASVDINLAPITPGIFNEAKSENKWTEAALVKVPTIASDVGAFAVAICNNNTGLLCNNEEEWYQALDKLIIDEKERKRLAYAAYQYVVRNYITIYTGGKLADYIKSKRRKNIAFVLPSLEISGGIMVTLKHASVLKREGMDVFIINDNARTKNKIVYDGYEFPVLSPRYTDFHGHIDQCVATMWSTAWFLEAYPNIGKRKYLVQNYETDFYKPGDALRSKAEMSYRPLVKVEFLTISKWVEKWLLERYGHQADYIPNGINIDRFVPCRRDFNEKIRVLIEGDSAVAYKGVDESFRIMQMLDKEKYETWYVSYNAEPKSWYVYDRFFKKVPYEKMPSIYSQCHILLKSSTLESFSYPPLEMMATGGYVVATPNGGNVEYLKDKENCLMYSSGNIKEAVLAIERISQDQELQNVLYKNGVETARKRNWDQIEARILEMYC